MSKNSQHRCHWQPSVFLLGLVLTTMALSSCDKEEPLRVGYYISLNSSELSDDKTFLIIRAMQDSIRAAYPKPDMKGNDKAVIRACSNAHRHFRVEHPEYFGGSAVARLHRGWTKGTVFKSSSVIATWNL